MGLMDKLKAAAQAVTGGAARVTLEYQPPVVFPGDTIQVRVTATSTGAEVQSRGAFIDLRGQEWVHLTRSEALTDKDISTTKTTFETAMSIGGPFTLAPNETKTWEGTVQVPPSVQPSFTGIYARHQWEIRGRIESFGNDPDSGWQPLRVGLKG